MTLLPHAETTPKNEMAAHNQKSWLRQSAYVAENSDFYRDLWAGQRPPVNLCDLHYLPLSDKPQLRLAQEAFPPFGNYLAASVHLTTRLHRTSGTSGQAMNLAMSARDCEITQIVGGRAQTAAGLMSDDKVVHCLNYQMWMGGVADHLTLEATGALVIPFGVGSTDLLIHTIMELGITAISCTPSYPAVLERVLADKYPDLTPRDLGLRLGLLAVRRG